jgi:pyruvate,orthophosphate dikinase
VRDSDYVLSLDGTRDLPRSLVGGKAWSINRLHSLGIDVPPAFVITTAAWRRWRVAGKIDEAIWREITAGVAQIEKLLGRRLGAATAPLLLSVRSGAAASMPGMMDTILNLGIDDAVEAALARDTGDPGFAADIHHRFADQFASVAVAGKPITSVFDQLRQAVTSVFASWDSPRAATYRAHHGLSDAAGTAVTVQAMVFGNRDARSGTGVLFSRNPLTGDHRPYGEWLPVAQGEDVVSGRVTPQPIEALRDVLPEVHALLLETAGRLEADAGDVQDIEFTVESGRLWLLQTRNAKRSPAAAVRLAVDLCVEGLIDVDTALARVSPDQVRTLLRPRLDPAAVAAAEVLARGEPACPGFARGIAVDDADEALVRGEDGEAVILVRATTSPDDIHGMIAAQAIVTASGGGTSHAAVVSREIGRPCIVGCGDGVVAALEGREVTVDGGSGTVYAGHLAVVLTDETQDAALSQLSAWAAVRSPLRVFLDSENLPPDVGAVRSQADDPSLATDAGIALAVAGGIAAVRVAQRLPAQLAALRVAQG